jgi:hypothetical protein
MTRSLWLQAYRLLARRMKEYLPQDDLGFLMRLSVEPTRGRLASRS